MAPSFEAANSTTASPAPKCPLFTYRGYNSETNQYFCDYQPWAYGLFAIACLLLILVPLVLIICCVVRRKHKRKFERRLRSTLSNTSYSSSEVPYQPLMRENRKNYGAVEHENVSASRISPNEESISEAPSSQQQDNTTTTSSKASMYPNYDQASLDFRNASALNTPRNSTQSTKNDFGPYASTKLVTDSVTPTKEMPGKAKSPIYAVLEEPSPKEPVLGSTEEEKIPSELKSPPNNDNIVAEDNKGNVENNEQRIKDSDNEKKPVVERLDDLYTLPGVGYAPNKVPHARSQELEPSSTESESREGSPIYNVLEPPLPDVPQIEKSPESKENEEEKSVDDVHEDDKSDNTKLSAECTDTPEETYTPLLPPRERPSSEAASDGTDSGLYQALVPKRRDRLSSRTDYEEFLREMIQSLPEEERNGAFVVRNSITDPGSKALTVYNKSLNSEKEVFNFKVCFNEGQVYLAKSTKRFPSLEELLQYLRTNKDMLPCTLKSQVN